MKLKMTNPQSLPQRSSRIALVDADVVCYTAGFGAERVLYKLYTSEDDAAQDKPALIASRRAEIEKAAEGCEYKEIHRTLEQDPMEYALHKAKLILEKIIGHTNATDVQLLLTGKGNFREEVATYRKYKGNRDFAKKPTWHKAIVEYLTKHWGAETIEGQEADDELAIRQLGTEGSTVICSTDKDLLQIPGLHYNLTKETLIEIQPEDGLNIFYGQCITGDSTDNIAGCPGLGKKAAEKLIEAGASWPKIVQAYKERMTKKLPDDMRRSGEVLHYKHWQGDRTVEKTIEEFALENAQLVYIRQKPGEIWTP